ncbi:acyl-CoA dehydrogenase family protein [Nocardia acidivorans]|uniref:acyl-CoA dehydrogenase family protein n=1 Tax=Nocardia acidivorans TaxID=404580 RepID=UPI0012F9865F|nr:acyl-CoA dehydrogenase family protein [Nocardia acidivorans]
MSDLMQKVNENDSRDEFPTEAIEALNRIKLYEYYIPEIYDGKLRDLDDTVNIVRGMARHNLGLAVAHAKTILGAVTVWVGGDHAVGARVSYIIRLGGAVSWGLTEREHGSDLLAGQLELSVDEAGTKHLSGEKWLINNATRGSALTLLARSAKTGGPRGFDLVLFEKAKHPEGSYETLDKELTFGIRGSDISGIRIHDAEIEDIDMISAPGRGIEMVMLGLQVTRTLCCGLSLGAADQALAAAYGFAQARTLYGRKLIELPQAQAVLAKALADHLLNEAFTTFVARSAHEMADELSVHCAAAKFVVPTRTEAIIRQLRSFSGAKSFLDDPTAVVLSRVERDHRIVSLFDGNTVVNLTSLIGQFGTLYRSAESSTSAISITCNMEAEVAPMDFGALTLFSRKGSSLLRELPDAVNALSEPLRDRATILLNVVDNTLNEISREPRTAVDIPNSSYVLAERISLCLAAAAAIHLAVHTAPVHGNPLWKNSVWLELVLDRALDCLLDRRDTYPETWGVDILETATKTFEHFATQGACISLWSSAQEAI